MMSFSLLRQPHVVFGAGKVSRLPELVGIYGKNVVIVTGAGILERSGTLSVLFEEIQFKSNRCRHVVVSGEPSPEVIDGAVKACRKDEIDVVVAVGGGSVIDAGKAVSAMLPSGEPVERFIEGLPGYRMPDGRKISFIAVPTTSGTGSEATNNAVISRTGDNGYKRSLRHEAFVPDIALLDPELTLSMPIGLTVSSGMDALTQLLEALVSTEGSPYTDAVAMNGLEYVAAYFSRACSDGQDDIKARGAMSWAAYLSGVALVNAGLGIVHGFASSIGGYIDIPHGRLCATLLHAATAENIAILRQKGDEADGALANYAKAGRLFAGEKSLNDNEACDVLLERLESIQEELDIARLGTYGFRKEDVDRIVSLTRNKNNPVALDGNSLRRILLERI